MDISFGRLSGFVNFPKDRALISVFLLVWNLKLERELRSVSTILPLTGTCMIGRRKTGEVEQRIHIFAFFPHSLNGNNGFLCTVSG